MILFIQALLIILGMFIVYILVHDNKNMEPVPFYQALYVTFFVALIVNELG